MNQETSYNLSELPDDTILMTEENRKNKSVLKWSGSYPIPQVGQRVKINFNGLGSGVVESYFIEHSFVGITVKLEDDPEWHQKQCKGTWYEGKALVFGQEITLEVAQ